MIEVGRTYGNNGWLVITSYYQLLQVLESLMIEVGRTYGNNGWLVITSYYQLLQVLESTDDRSWKNIWK